MLYRQALLGRASEQMERSEGQQHWEAKSHFIERMAMAPCSQQSGQVYVPCLRLICMHLLSWQSSRPRQTILMCDPALVIEKSGS